MREVELTFGSDPKAANIAMAPPLDGLDWVMTSTERGSGFAVAVIAPPVINARTINSKRTAHPASAGYGSMIRRTYPPCPANFRKD